MTKVKERTNKQLIEYGLGQDELLELVETNLLRTFGEDDTINGIEWGGDEETTSIYFEDHHGRTWVVYYIDGECEDTLFVHSYKNSEDREEVNAKACKRISAVINHIKRVIG